MQCRVSRYHASDTVVKCFCRITGAAQLLKHGDYGTNVADLDALFSSLLVLGTDIDDHLLYGDVCSLGAVFQNDDTGHAVLEANLLIGGSHCVDTANVGNVNVAVAVDGGDYKADLIHVGGDHQLAGGILTLFQNVQIADGVGLNSIRNGSKLLCNNISQGLLSAGYGKSGGEFFS